MAEKDYYNFSKINLIFLPQIIFLSGRLNETENVNYNGWQNGIVSG
jgi:hypothetical protein